MLNNSNKKGSGSAVLLITIEGNEVNMSVVSVVDCVVEFVQEGTSVLVAVET